MVPQSRSWAHPGLAQRYLLGALSSRQGQPQWPSGSLLSRGWHPLCLLQLQQLLPVQVDQTGLHTCVPNSVLHRETLAHTCVWTGQSAEGHLPKERRGLGPRTATAWASLLRTEDSWWAWSVDQTL